MRIHIGSLGGKGKKGTGKLKKIKEGGEKKGIRMVVLMESEDLTVQMAKETNIILPLPSSNFPKELEKSLRNFPFHLIF